MVKHLIELRSNVNTRLANCKGNFRKVESCTILHTTIGVMKFVREQDRADAIQHLLEARADSSVAAHKAEDSVCPGMTALELALSDDQKLIAQVLSGSDRQLKYTEV